MALFGKNKEKRFTRVFFATDVHGSERTFRKFLNAGKYYEVDIVMLCGDLTGKMVVPITESPDGTYVCRLFGQDHKASTKDELASLEEKVSDTGFYPYQTNQKEVAELRADPAKIDGIFKRLMLEKLQRWVKMVEEHYKNTGIKCIMTGGNDDPNEIEQILNSSSVVVNSEGQLIKLNEHHEMITVSHANLTPWKCPRDVSEEILKDMISNLAGKVEKMESCHFQFARTSKGFEN